MVFSWQNGTLYCEGLSLVAIREQVGHTPFYIYSANQIRENFNAYKNAVRGLPAVISYALKANGKQLEQIRIVIHEQKRRRAAAR